MLRKMLENDPSGHSKEAWVHVHPMHTAVVDLTEPTAVPIFGWTLAFATKGTPSSLLGGVRP
jgi:hypothetical protein